MSKHNLKVPTIIAVSLLLTGVVAGIALIQTQQSVQTSATAEKAPYNVTVSNVQDDSFTVTWTTDVPTLGFLLWGKETNPVTPAQSMGSGEKEVHMVKVKSLEANTAYSFTVTSSGTEYKNEGMPWTVTTGPQLNHPESSRVISGSVISKDGKPVSQAIVVVQSKNMAPMTTMTSSSGSWVVPLNLARNIALSKYVDVSEDTLDITVLSSTQGKATAVVKGNIATALPPIVIGRSHDFTNLTASAEDFSPPEAQIALPNEQVQGVSDSALVTIDSLDNGEVIFTNKPEFFGDGPVGKSISITVHSDSEITDSVQVSSDGQWIWSPLKALENGLHNITLEWMDTQGIVHTLTRSFIVQAQEDEPSFESTPSGSTASPSPTATATPKPTTSPSPSPTATSKATASASPTGTPKGGNLPDAGIVTPSILMGAAGFVTLSLGAVLALKK